MVQWDKRSGCWSGWGSSCWTQEVILLPFRLVSFLLLFALVYPLLLVVGVLRATFLRLVVGLPSKILRFGRRGDDHQPDNHYCCHQLYKEALDEDRFRKALVELCAEAGIKEDEVELKFFDEAPNDWPTTNSYNANYFIPSLRDKFKNYFTYWLGNKSGQYKIRFHVWNATEKGKPTVAYFGGSANGWDGSSNFNFTKELMNRYVGNAPNDVFLKPEIAPEAAKKFDDGYFIWFMMKFPINLALNLASMVWNLIRTAKWAGGPGINLYIHVMNFNKEESIRLYAGAKSMGHAPFSIMTYACVKACKEVLGQQPKKIQQQASLQSRHYPVSGGTATRNLVGCWLFGPLQDVDSDYTLDKAKAGYKNLGDELREIGPATRASIWAKAYGILNSGAAGFEMLPTYNENNSVFGRCLFMNNYGVRTMPEGSPFHSWNWNAPFWLGFNTINVDGCTTTQIGSCLWGDDVVMALRDNIEATLRDIMAKAPADAAATATIPTYVPETGSAAPPSTAV